MIVQLGACIALTCGVAGVRTKGGRRARDRRWRALTTKLFVAQLCQVISAEIRRDRSCRKCVCVVLCRGVRAQGISRKRRQKQRRRPTPGGADDRPHHHRNWRASRQEVFFTAYTSTTEKRFAPKHETAGRGRDGASAAASAAAQCSTTQTRLLLPSSRLSLNSHNKLETSQGRAGRGSRRGAARCEERTCKLLGNGLILAALWPFAIKALKSKISPTALRACSGRGTASCGAPAA